MASTYYTHKYGAMFTVFLTTCTDGWWRTKEVPCSFNFQFIISQANTKWASVTLLVSGTVCTIASMRHIWYYCVVLSRVSCTLMTHLNPRCTDIQGVPYNGSCSWKKTFANFANPVVFMTIFAEFSFLSTAQRQRSSRLKHIAVIALEPGRLL